MEHFSIPERLEPVAPTENTRRQSLTSDQRRRNQNPSKPQKPRDDDNDPPEDGDNAHNIDELA